MVGVMAACNVFPPSVSYFLAISIVGMVKGQLLLFVHVVHNVSTCVPVNVMRNVFIVRHMIAQLYETMTA